MNNRVNIVVNFLIDNNYITRCGIFDTKNVVGDKMKTIYNKDGIKVDICYQYDYLEVFGFSDDDFKDFVYQYYGRLALGDED